MRELEDAAFVTLGMVSAMFEETITGLITASGVFGVVMGLALQSTLADLFSGIALNLQRPFRVGDWIQVDSGILGEVTEMNWRAKTAQTKRSTTMKASSPAAIHHRKRVARAAMAA